MCIFSCPINFIKPIQRQLSLPLKEIDVTLDLGFL